MCRAPSILLVALFFGLAHSWDIAVTAGDRIEFYTDGGAKVDTVRFISQNLTALAYDEVHNMLLYVDRQSGNDAICAYNISNLEYKCYISRFINEGDGRNIQGLAFDPVTERLFFTDTKERSINWMSFKDRSLNNFYGNLLIKMDKGIPTDIAVDSCRGYIYWINTNLTTSTIERARINGSEREVVVNSTNGDLDSLAIDQQAQKMYWRMSETELEKRIYSADFNGEYKRAIIRVTRKSPMPDHPNALVVLKQALLRWSRCATCNSRSVYKYIKPINTGCFTKLFRLPTRTVVGIATNYKINDQFQGISECKHVLNLSKSNESFKVARMYDPFCALLG